MQMKKNIYPAMQRNPMFMLAKSGCCQETLVMKALHSKDHELTNRHKNDNGKSIGRYQIIEWLIYQLPNIIKRESAQNENQTTILGLLVASIAYSRADIDLFVSVAPALRLGISIRKISFGSYK